LKDSPVWVSRAVMRLVSTFCSCWSVSGVGIFLWGCGLGVL
jgi:hypothetical protein